MRAAQPIIGEAAPFTAQVPKDRERRFLAPYEVARFCGVPTEEVLGWISAGALKAAYIPVGRYRISVDDLLVFLARDDHGI